MRIAHVTRDFYGKELSSALEKGFDVDVFASYKEVRNPNEYDILLIEYCGVEAIEASRHEHRNLMIRTRGVEVYEGNLRRLNWQNIKWLLVLGKHQKYYFEKRWGRYNCKPQNIGWLPHLAPLDKFTLRKNPVKNNSVAMLSNITGRKGSDHVPDFLLKYKDKKIFHRGTICAYGYSIHEFVRWRLEKNKMAGRYDHKEWIDFNEINDWLENKTYLFFPSIGESFGRAIIECMCKGLKPIINNFYGAEDLWPKEFLYDNFDEIDQIINSSYEPEKYRQWVADRYSKEKILELFKGFLDL